MLGKLIKTKSLISIICLFFLMGCAYHTGNISTGSYIDCPLLRLETGTAKATIFFGIGGLSKDALILEAKKNLISKINFKNNLKITNYTVDYKNTYFLFYHSNTVTVSAEIYNCGGEIETQTTKLDSNFSLSPIINGFRLKDSVIFINQNIQTELIPATIIMLNKRNIQIQYGDNIIKKKYTSYDNILKMKKNDDTRLYFKYEVGDTANIQIRNIKQNTLRNVSCTVLGINKMNAYISYTNSNGELKKILVDLALLK